MHDGRSSVPLHSTLRNEAERDALCPRLMQEPSSAVYIVDDDSAVRSALSLLVGTCGWKAKPYPSAEDFLQNYARERPACLLLDIKMEGMSGVELQGLLKTLDAELPVIVITAHADHPIADRARDAGAREVLGKPFRDSDLIEALSEALGTQAQGPGPGPA